MEGKMFKQFGSWMTKLGGLLLVSPEIGNLIGNALNQHDAIAEGPTGTIKTLGMFLMGLGIRRAIK